MITYYKNRGRGRYDKERDGEWKNREILNCGRNQYFLDFEIIMNFTSLYPKHDSLIPKKQLYKQFQLARIILIEGIIQVSL